MCRYIDMHIHSTFSDGKFTPKEIVEKAKKKGLSAIAITDHNTIRSAVEIKNNLRDFDIEILQGIELTAYDKEEIHILGYFFNLDEKVIDDFITLKKNDYIKLVLKIVKKLIRKGIDISIEDAKSDNEYSISKLEKILVEKGYANDNNQAKEMLLGDNKEEYLKLRRASSKECIEVIKRAGGIAILAHPGKLKIEKENFIQELNNYISYGIDGIECLYPDHSEEQKEFFINLCNEFNLLITGGSDYHGDDVHTADIGDMKVPYELYEKMANLIY
jgi:predicted metal-dependent phosphoesterase TrpH